MLRTALVTGAGSGIGRASTLALVEAGYHVAIAGRHVDSLAETQASCGSRERVAVVRADVRDADDVRAAFTVVLDQWGRLDLLVNNAGVFGAAEPLEDVTGDQWDTVFAINLTGAFLCTQYAVRQMKKQNPPGGRIINIGSVSAHRPRPNSVAYAVSKHALTGLTRVTSLEGRDASITCTQIDIGNAATAMSHATTISPAAVQAGGFEETFDVVHVGSLVATVAALPVDVTVSDLTVFATGMPYLARG